MYDDDFRDMFFEFLHENSDNEEMLKAIEPFIEYGWGTLKFNGERSFESENSQRNFILWMAENGASLEAMEAVIKMLRND